MYKPVVVALKRDGQLPLQKQLEQVMVPFVYDPDSPERTSRCDGWRVGGHWAGHFLSRHKRHPDLVNPISFPQGSPLSAFTACDGGPKRLLDLDHLRRTAEERVWRRWPTRVARLFGLREPWRHMSGTFSDRDVDSILKGNPELLASARGHAVVQEGLVTLQGEWINPDCAQDEREAAYIRADACIDALDDDAWLIRLSVHH